MFFHIDESGNTGNNLFDPNQPVLSYGLLSAKTSVDARGKRIHGKMLARLGVDMLHANELRNEGLAQISDLLIELQDRVDLRFDYYFIKKPDFALITFFDHVFDPTLNVAVPWTLYWTPLRYAAIVNLAELFDEGLLKKTWDAATATDMSKSINDLRDVFPELLARLETTPLDSRTTEIFKTSFEWAHQYPEHLDFHASSKWQTKYMSPNVVGFQFVLSAIARRMKRVRGARRSSRNKQPNSFVVDRQHQFNSTQLDLQKHYRAISEGSKKNPFPSNFLDVDFNAEYSNMPATPFQISASIDSVGLQITDVYLWLFCRMIKEEDIDNSLRPLLARLLKKSVTDGISLEGIIKRFQNFEAKLPALEDCDPEQAKLVLEIQETNRVAAIEEHARRLV